MAGTGYIDTNGNRHIISGMVTGELPKYTMAEYTALTNKPIDWICTDYDATSEYGINDTEVKHGDTTVNAMINTIDVVNDVKYVRGKFDLTSGSTPQEYIQGVISAISTDNKMTEIDVNIVRYGSHKFSGYVYANKLYGSGIFQTFGGSLIFWKRDNGTDSFFNVTKTAM